jgi:hypothetical protein
MENTRGKRMITVKGFKVAANRVTVTLERVPTTGDITDAHIAFSNMIYTPVGGVYAEPSSLKAMHIPPFTEPHPQFQHPAQMLDYALSVIYETEFNARQLNATINQN